MLDSTARKTITEGELEIQNNNNRSYICESSDVVVNNTMTTPKGGQYQLTLADGTRLLAECGIIYYLSYSI